jgi:hypothetical protein
VVLLDAPLHQEQKGPALPQLGHQGADILLRQTQALPHTTAKSSVAWVQLISKKAPSLVLQWLSHARSIDLCGKLA